MTSTPIDIADAIDRRRTTGFQLIVFLLCMLCLLVDGFDLQALGYVAPAVVQDFNIPNAALGTVFGAANVGLLIGTLLFSMLADKIGRRPVLIGTTVFFGVVTLFTGRATSVQELLVLRFVAGIGLGWVIPNATALVSEYSPRRKRITAIMILTTLGLNGGAIVGGIVSAWLIMNLLTLYFLASWLPLVISDAGHSISTAVLVSTGLQIGGIFGALALAWLIGRRGFVPVLTSSLAVAAVTIALIGRPGLPLPLLTGVVFVAGSCVIGSQLGMNALAALTYPTYLRSSGVGWSAGVGRVGAIVGPVIGGELMRLQWPTDQIFLAAAVPVAIATAAMFSMRWTVNEDLRQSLRPS